MVSRNAKSSLPPSKGLQDRSLEQHSDDDDDDEEEDEADEDDDEELSKGSLHSPPSIAEKSTAMSDIDTNEATSTAHPNVSDMVKYTRDDEEDPSSENEKQRQQQQANNENDENDATEASTAGPLYKSSRLRGYMTLALASFINYDGAANSAERIGIHVSVVTSTPKQRGYASAVAVVSLIVSAACFLLHLDRFSPLRKFWQTLFKQGSKFEGLILAFLTTWWTVAALANTSVRGLAGDGRGQFSLYYSTWVCCFTCYWMVERWWVAAGLSSFKAFIDSWPNRSPAWICLLILSLTTSIWYLDLWQNHDKLTRPSEALILSHFETVSQLQWQWLVIVTIVTFCPSIVFVLIELFRGTNPDGSITAKSKGEIIIEGCCFLTLALAWIPTVMIATTPRGAASLIGNAYFCTWINAIAVCEGLVWFIHDKRRETHELLQRKRLAYIRRQDKVMEEALEIQKRLEQKEAVAVQTRSSAEGNRAEEEEIGGRTQSDVFEAETGDSMYDSAEL